MKVNKLILFIFMGSVIIQCKKEPLQNPDSEFVDKDSTFFQANFILAGDTLNYKYSRLNFNLDNITVSDSVPSTGGDWGSSSFEDTPIDIDNDKSLDIRYGCGALYRNDYLILKMFIISNNYDNDKKLEFAVENNEIINLDDTVKMISWFNLNDTINFNHRWIASDNAEKYYLTLYCDFEEYFDDFIGKNESINENVKNKYIGVRIKNGEKYIYGWLKGSVYNHERLILSGSSFAYWYENKD